MKKFKQFMKQHAPEYDIQEGSSFEAKLYLAYEEMSEIFKSEKYKLDHQIEQLEKDIKTYKDCYRSEIINLKKQLKELESILFTDRNKHAIKGRIQNLLLNINCGKAREYLKKYIKEK